MLWLTGGRDEHDNRIHEGAEGASRKIDEIAKLERRTPSNVVRMAIEQFVSQYEELHPQFRADIVEALEQMKAGEVVPYEYG